MNKKLLLYIGILVGTTLILYSFVSFLSTMDWKYFKAHEAQLTIVSNKGIQGGSATYYNYKHTPYYYPSIIIRVISLVVPIWLVFLFSIRFLLKNIDKKPLIKSLCFPVIYGVINILYFLLAMDPAAGWEYDLGLKLILIEAIFVFILVAIVNGVILSKKLKVKS